MADVVKQYDGRDLLRVNKLGASPKADLELVFVETDGRGRHLRMQVSQQEYARGRAVRPK